MPDECVQCVFVRVLEIWLPVRFFGKKGQKPSDGYVRTHSYQWFNRDNETIISKRADYLYGLQPTTYLYLQEWGNMPHSSFRVEISLNLGSAQK